MNINCGWGQGKGWRAASKVHTCKQKHTFLWLGLGPHEGNCHTRLKKKESIFFLETEVHTFSEQTCVDDLLCIRGSSRPRGDEDE